MLDTRASGGDRYLLGFHESDILVWDHFRRCNRGQGKTGLLRALAVGTLLRCRGLRHRSKVSADVHREDQDTRTGRGRRSILINGRRDRTLLYTAARHSLRISLAKCVDSTHIELNRFYELSVSRHLAPGWIDGTRGNLPCDRSIHGGFSVFYGRLCEAPKAIAALRYGLGKIAIDSWIALDRLGCQTRYVRFGHVRWCWIRLFWLWSKG